MSTSHKADQSGPDQSSSQQNKASLHKRSMNFAWGTRPSDQPLALTSRVVLPHPTWIHPSSTNDIHPETSCFIFPEPLPSELHLPTPDFPSAQDYDRFIYLVSIFQVLILLARSGDASLLQLISDETRWVFPCSHVGIKTEGMRNENWIQRTPGHSGALG